MEQFPVTITVRGEQRQGGEVTQMEHTIPGTLETDGETLILRYREPEEAGLGGTDTILTFRGEEAVLERQGAVSTRMPFIVGQRHRVEYRTPVGEILLEVRTTFLSHNLTRTGGKAMLRYHLTSGGETVGNHTLKLNVKEREL